MTTDTQTSGHTTVCLCVWRVTHILVVLQEDVEVEVLPEDRMSRHTTQEDLVHGHCLLKDGQVLSEWKHTAVSVVLLPY